MFSIWGIPEEVYTNNGPQHSSHEFRNVANTYMFQHRACSPHFPQSNGDAERQSRTDSETNLVPRRCFLGLDDVPQHTSRCGTNHRKTSPNDSAGFGLLESGLVSKKDEVNIMMKNAIDVIVGGLSFWLFGYAFSFGDDVTFMGGFTGGNRFMLRNKNAEDSGNDYARFFFHSSFATTATTIVSGAMAERVKLPAYTLFSFLNTIIYCFPAHWIFSKDGWLRRLGMVDMAGGGPVHLLGGVTGLVATIMLTPRHGRFGNNAEQTRMACPTNALLGMFMLCNGAWRALNKFSKLTQISNFAMNEEPRLIKQREMLWHQAKWWGWLGFNCGSTLGVSELRWKLAARSAVSTTNAATGGGLMALLLSLRNKEYNKKLDTRVVISASRPRCRARVSQTLKLEGEWETEVVIEHTTGATEIERDKWTTVHCV
ncbi:putative ammonium transporter 3 [Lamellibrachia satsuma]|nr:putative ammonium transporter 3 [Lamellibrachia satsuma]